MTIDIREYLVCGTCDTAVTADEHEAGPLYECNSCGDVFTRENSASGDSNRCPSCGKMAAKSADYGCSDCNEEMESRDGFICPHCDKFVSEDD